MRKGLGNTHLPPVMRPPSTRQMSLDAKSGIGGHAALATANLGKVIYFDADGVVNPQPQLAVRADINAIPGGNALDGANWIVTVRPGPTRNNAINSPFWMATMSFGTGGVNTEIQATANPGFSCSLPADYVEVTIGVNPQHGSSVIVAGRYDFNVTVHRGMPNGDSEVKLRAQTNGVSGLLPIPAFAKYFLPVSDNCFAGGTSVAFSGGFDYTGAQLTSIVKQSGGVPIVPTGDSTIFWTPENQVYVFDWILEL